MLYSFLINLFSFFFLLNVLLSHLSGFSINLILFFLFLFLGFINSTLYFLLLYFPLMIGLPLLFISNFLFFLVNNFFLFFFLWFCWLFLTLRRQLCCLTILKAVFILWEIIKDIEELFLHILFLQLTNLATLFLFIRSHYNMYTLGSWAFIIFVIIRFVCSNALF